MTHSYSSFLLSVAALIAASVAASVAATLAVKAQNIMSA
jgi:hypothetical protein